MAKRSNPLNDYYWGVCVEMIKDRLNYLKACLFLLDKDDTHYIIKTVTQTQSTAKLDNKQFLEFIEEVWCIGAHLGIIIPDPNYIHMKEIHEAIDLVLEAKEKANMRISINTDTDGISFVHFGDKKPNKHLVAYYKGSLSNFRCEESHCVPISEFVTEIRDYINSVTKLELCQR